MKACEFCAHNQYDEEADVDYCDVSLDEDEMERYLSSANTDCPYFKLYDEYKMVEKQN